MTNKDDKTERRRDEPGPSLGSFLKLVIGKFKAPIVVKA